MLGVGGESESGNSNDVQLGPMMVVMNPHRF